jgi:uncharacterized protein YlxW (UPF0749 family)
VNAGEALTLTQQVFQIQDQKSEQQQAKAEAEANIQNIQEDQARLRQNIKSLEKVSLR